MEAQQLKCKSRSLLRSSGVKKLRSSGNIPGVVYGHNIDPVSIEISEKAFEKLIKKSESDVIITDLEIEGNDRPARKVLLKNVQHHVLNGNVLHVDFLEVSDVRPVAISVPVQPVGESVGVKNSGGTLGIILNRVNIKALPQHLPSVVKVDISAMKVGDIFYVKDMPELEGVEYTQADNIQIMTIIPPRVSKTAEGEGEAKK